MPIITTDAFKTKASEYHFRMSLYIAATIVVTLCAFMYANAERERFEPDNLSGYVVCIDPVLLWRAIVNYRRYRHINDIPPLAVHQIDFSPALSGQQPMKVILSFQWPSAYDRAPEKREQIGRAHV